MKIRRLTGCAVSYFLLFVMLFIALAPIYWMLVTSLKGESEIYKLVPTLWPKELTWEGYTNLVGNTGFMSWLKNSAIVALAVSAVSLFFSVLAAYGLARLRFRGRQAIGTLILVAYLLPPTLLFIPLYILITRLHLQSSMQGLIFAYPTITIPYATWVLTSYFTSISVDFEEAALIDGCSRLGALRRIVIPLSAPAIVSTFIFCFTLCWSEFLFALVILTGANSTVPVGLAGLILGDVARWNQIMAGAIITSIPVVILYTLASRYIVSGLTLGGVKG